MRWEGLAAAGTLAIAWMAVPACGSTDDSGDGTGGYGASANGKGGGAPQDGSFFDVAQGNDSSGLGDGPTCAAQSFKGETRPLDMYIMMDQSGSMISTIDQAKTTSKWKAVTTGMSSFLQAQAGNSGLGVGIQFFPLPVKPLGSLPQCPNNSACQSGSYCVHTGDQFLCMSSCQNASTCPGTECVAAGSVNVCAYDSCDSAQYAVPEVPITPIGQGKDAVNAAMNAHLPMLYTPTVPALTGAIQYARSYEQSHPERKVIVVLATDGLPSECPSTKSTDELIAFTTQIAAGGLAGSPSVETFVIGVVKFGDDESAANLDQIAAAGGTGKALIVQVQDDMAAQFASALDQIKGSALSCEYEIPEADGGKPDLMKVNVVYSVDGGAQQTVYYVGSAGQCDASAGGWYYDADPKSSTPTSIKLCPQTCDTIRKPGQTIDLGIQIGCQTQQPPPK